MGLRKRRVRCASAQQFEISYTIPSHCAEQLKEGSADIGIIPVAAYTTIPDLVIVPDVAIAAKNKVRSILLVSKVAIDKIRSVATDDSSRTSAALVEIYLRKFVGAGSWLYRQKPSLKEMLQWHDAALLIGDPALRRGPTATLFMIWRKNGSAGPGVRLSLPSGPCARLR